MWFLDYWFMHNIFSKWHGSFFNTWKSKTVQWGFKIRDFQSDPIPNKRHTLHGLEWHISWNKREFGGTYCLIVPYQILQSITEKMQQTLLFWRHWSDSDVTGKHASCHKNEPQRAMDKCAPFFSSFFVKKHEASSIGSDWITVVLLNMLGRMLNGGFESTLQGPKCSSLWHALQDWHIIWMRQSYGYSQSVRKLY